MNHKDGNKANNHYTNLEWTTIAANIQHSHDTGLRVVPRGKDNPLFGRKASLDTRKLQSLAKQGTRHPKFKGYYIANYVRFHSAGEASRHLNIAPRTIYDKCHNEKFRSSGFWFEPVEK